MTEKNMKWTYYGKAGQLLPRAIRWCCREILYNQIDKVILQESLKDSIRQGERLMRDMQELGYVTETLKRDVDILRDIMTIHEIYRYVHSLLEGDLPLHCRYSDRPTPRSCWGCNHPRKLIQKLRADYEREKRRDTDH